MAKKNKKSSAAAEAAAAKQKQGEKKNAKEEQEGDVEFEEEMELLQVDVGDIIKVKQILDETVAGTMVSEDISAHGEAVQIREEYAHDNLKLFLMALACSFAAVAQFGLASDFPKNRLWLGVCCAAYFSISGILQLIMTFVDKDCIMQTKPLTDSEAIKLVNSGGNKEMDKYGIRGKQSSEIVKETWSVGQFFDVDGFFDEEGLMIEVESLYQRFEAGKFDKPTGGKGGPNVQQPSKTQI